MQNPQDELSSSSRPLCGVGATSQYYTAGDDCEIWRQVTCSQQWTVCDTLIATSVALDFWFYSSEPQFLIYWRVLIIMPVWQGFHKRLNLLSHAFSIWWSVVSTQFTAGESQSSKAESLWEARLEFSGPGSAFPTMLHPAQWDIWRCQSQSILDTSAFLPILVDNSGVR